jgi:hypothetical protein
VIVPGNLYFKRYWSESRGDEYDAWGGVMYYFETDEEGHLVSHDEFGQGGVESVRLLKGGATHPQVPPA